VVRPTEVAVARLIKPHGVRGEVEAKALTPDPDRIRPGSSFQLSPARSDYPHVSVEGVRTKKDRLIIKFAGIDDREAAARLHGALMMVPVDELPALDENTYYHFDLIGLRVVTSRGRRLGRLEEIIETGANDVYLVRDDLGDEALIPALRSVIVAVDLEEGVMVIEPMAGLLPEDADED
jgi:16S rRNA processing protein RimM